MGFCESRLTSQNEQSNAAILANRDATNDSRHSSIERSTTQLLRKPNRGSSQLKNPSQARIDAEESQQMFIERINNLQIQIDRLDQRQNQLREEQMRQMEDPRPLI